MTDSRPRHPVSDTLEGGGAEPTPAAAAAAAAASAEDAPIYAHRIGCVLHILHLAVTAGLTNPFFMGPLGKGSELPNGANFDSEFLAGY